MTHKEEEFNLQLKKAKVDLIAKAQKEALESVNLDMSDLKIELEEKSITNTPPGCVYIY